MARAAAALFGLNYAGTDSELRGCANDVANVAALLRSTGKFVRVGAFNDGDDYAMCTGGGMVREITRLAASSWSEQLDLAWIHFSGHGTWERDRTGDERDGRDEAVCPADFATGGLLFDDDIRQLLRMFNPRTRVVFVCDSCHSGTMGDLRWRFTPDGGREEERPDSECAARVLLLSGCGDPQTSADAFGVDGARQQFTGAMTACLLACLRDRPDLAADALALLDAVRDELLRLGFDQVPQLSASYDVAADRAFLPWDL